MKKRILILEDDPRILEIEEIILGREGYDVIAVDKYHPLDYLLQFSPGLIILDVRLSNGYGHLLCKDLKSNPVTSNIPVILISSSNNLAVIAKECNADSYISKPFNVEELISVVKKYD